MCRWRATPPHIFGKYVLALAFIMLLIWGALLVNGKALQMRMWLLFLLLLITVALHALMVRTLPQTGHLTFLDRYLLTCYATIGLTVLIAIVVKTLYTTWPHRLVPRLDRGLAIAYPLLFLGLNAALFWYALA